MARGDVVEYTIRVYNEKEVSRSKRKNKETKAVKTAGENNEEKTNLNKTVSGYGCM